MQEEIRSFNKGINQDVSPLQQPTGTYPYALNFVQLSKDGNMFALTNEEGTVLQTTTFPDGFLVMGHVVLNNEVFVSLAHPNGFSQIGYIRLDGTYIRSCPSIDETDADANTNDELGFTTSRPVDMQARIRLSDQRMLYFCDGVGGVNLSFLNADSVPAIGEIADNTKVIPNQLIPVIDLEEVQEVSGNLRVGAYFFMSRYYTEDLTPTSYGIPSGMIPITEDYSEVGRDQFDGEYPDYGAVNKAIAMTFSNIDTSYPFLEVIVIRYEGITNTFTAVALQLKNIVSSEMTFSYSGNETDVTSVTQEELNTASISYSSAKAVIQKDNVLFWSNLADNSNRFDAIMQQFANDITLRYFINEVEYEPSTAEQDASGGFGLDTPPFLDTSEDPILSVYLQYNEAINAEDSNVTTNYTLTTPSVAAAGYIQISDGAQLFGGGVGDTIVIDDGNGTIETYTAIEGTPAVFEFDVQSQNNQTIATNLAASIGANSAIAFAAATDTIVQVEATTTGTVSNTYTITYNDLSGTGDGVVLYEGDQVTTGNPVSMTGGADGSIYNPDTVTGNLTNPEDDSLIILTFSITDFPNGLSAGSDLAWSTYRASDGVLYSDTNEVVAGASSVGNAENLGTFNDYKSEFLTFYQKGYQRGEVYSFGFTGIFKDGSQSFNYAIPGNNKEVITTQEAVADNPGVWDDNAEGNLGTYISTVDNPTNQNYPGDGSIPGDDTLCWSLDATTGNVTQVTPSNRLTRHFKMPTLQQEPHFRYDTSTGRTYIRILGIAVTFNSVMPEALRDELQSIMITRQRRNSNQNKSIFAQGLVNRYCQIYNSSNYDGDTSNPVWKKMPFVNQTNIFNNNTTNSSFGSSNAPSTTFETKDDDTPIGGSRDTSLTLRPVNERMAFHSPESQLGALNSNNAEGTQLTPVLQLSAYNADVRYNFKPSKQIAEWFAAFEESTIRYFYQGWVYIDFARSGTIVGSTETNLVDAAKYIPKGQNVTVAGMVYEINNTLSSRHLYLKVNNRNVTPNQAGAPNFGVGNSQDITFQANVKLAAGITDQTKHVTNNDRLTSSFPITNNLFNLQADNPAQYGNLSGADYIPVITSNLIPTTAGEALGNVYGGDTYISKFSFRNYDVYKYRGAYNKSYTGMRYYNSGADYYDQAFPTDTAQGADLKCLTQFFVESTINCNYRHRYTDRADPTNEIQEAPYFPKETLENVWKSWCTAGDSKGYNLQYSFENDIRTYSNKLAAQTTVGAFPNRTIHSNISIEDEVIDAYRVYKQNSYYDLPKHTGEIWDNFVYNNTLFLHTPKSLWRAFVNDVTQQATSAGEVVMGTGGLFTMPAKEMIVSTGGYAGTISQWAGVVTPYAYFFPDVLQGKSFMLQGDQLREISQQGLQQFFFQTLATGLVDSVGNYTDNPFTGAGMLGAYDFEKKRYIISKKGTTDDFTLSYSSLTESWISFHSYQPNLYFSQNTNLFAVINDSTAILHQHNEGTYGVYYDAPAANSELTVIFNEAAGIDKTWDNMKHHTVSSGTNGIIQQFDTWTSMRVYSDTRNTGWYDMIVTNAYGSKAIDDPTTQIRVRRNNNKFNLTIPADVVIDDGQDLFDLGNQDPTALFKPRMKGDHITTNFVYDNADEYEFIVNFISATFRPNHS